MRGCVPVVFLDLGEAVAFREGEHGFGLGCVEGRLISQAKAAVQ